MPPLLMTSGFTMKRVSQLTALALICGLASLSSMAADMPHSSLWLSSRRKTAR